ILDEPSAALDLVCKEDIKRYLQIYLERKGTVVITTHEESELSLCNSLYVMKDGKLVQIDKSLRGSALTAQF
ncbi:MAG: ATP-binding protein, partial [Lachnospiraceae bacterium]|nr:ATP-binding protein [Lachnospiraceae bacterium]